MSVYDNCSVNGSRLSRHSIGQESSTESDNENVQISNSHVIKVSSTVGTGDQEVIKKPLKQTVSFDSSLDFRNKFGRVQQIVDADISSSSSSSSPSPRSHEASISSFRDRSISFESSSSRTCEDQSVGERTKIDSSGSSHNSSGRSSNENGRSLNGSCSSGISRQTSSSSNGVVHSTSDNSYFHSEAETRISTSTSAADTTRACAEKSGEKSSTSGQDKCSEFDLILQQLYNNIDDLTRSMRSGVKGNIMFSSPLRNVR